jgi:Ca2+-dependent lipid-binding protein
MSKVEVTIRYATLNKNYDFVGKMENYVKVKVNNGTGGSTEFKTKIVPGDKDSKIEWNETFSVPIKPNTGSLFEFNVMDEDMTTDDLCGKGLFKPDRCGVFNYGSAQNYNVRLVNGPKDEIAGGLHITTRYV